jgi:hypothetical protein
MKSWNLARLALRTLLVLAALLGGFFVLIASFLGLTVAKKIYCVRGRGRGGGSVFYIVGVDSL